MIDARGNYLACWLLANACAPAAAPPARSRTPDVQVAVDIETVPTAAPLAKVAGTRDTATSPTGEPPHPCDVMRRQADGDADDGAVPHLRDQSLERSIRSYYEREVLAPGIDQRSLAQHPLVFALGVKASAATVSACVDYWREEDPGGVVPGVPSFVADHDYLEVTFEFNDASDGENAYTAFVDAKTLQVVAGFFYNNFQP